MSARPIREPPTARQVNRAREPKPPTVIPPVPQFLVRLVGWERARASIVNTPLRHRHD